MYYTASFVCICTEMAAFTSLKGEAMKKACFVIPYFGKFNNYFDLFLLSCGANPDFNWLIFTDDHYPYLYPNNVKVIYMTFEEMQNYIIRYFDFEVSISKPYKLCDYRVAYGYLFEEYLTGFSMWGYCDTDLIWGDISKFITDEMISTYDKIGVLGHCTLFKNTKVINRMFMQELNGEILYQSVLSNPQNCSFDEEYKKSINNIFDANNMKVYDRLPIANIYMKSSDFRLTSLIDKSKYVVEKKSRNIFVWDNGSIFRYIQSRKKGKTTLGKEEYLYIHMQSRKMRVLISKPIKRFKIIPNAFEPCEAYPIAAENIRSIKCKHFNLHYFRLRSKNLIVKCKRYINKKRKR